MNEFKIKPGQFMIFRFLQKGFFRQTHPFSLSMLPQNDQIRLTAKKLGDFTNNMPQLKAGTKVIVDGPHGVFTRDQIVKDKLLFIAGGIGITPIRAMLEETENIPKDTILLYANKTKADIALAKEIDELSKRHNFTVIHILADEKLPGYEHGRLDKAMLQSLIPDVADREVFLCGPPMMMTALRQALKKLNVHKEDIHFERFAL